MTFAPRSQATRTRHARRIGLLAVLSLGLYGCTGGLSCGGDAGGCINAYPYPQSQLSNGVATVDDGARMRMTQAALDFLRVHLQDVLVASFETVPGNPSLIRFDAGPIEIASSDYANARIGQRKDGSLHPTYILIDANELQDRLEFEFLDGPPDGVRVRIAGLPVGVDARAYADWVGGGTAGCDLDGTRCPAGDPDCGMVTDLTVELFVYPDVGQGAQCDTGEGECLLIDVQLGDFSLGGINNGDFEITVPPFRDVSWTDPNGCTYADAPPLCEKECSDGFIGQDADWECRQLCGAADFFADAALAISGALAGFLEPYLANTLEGAIRDALADFDGAPLSISDKMDLAAMSTDLINPTAHPLGFMIAPTGSAFDVNCPAGVNCAQTQGMDLNLRSGMEAAPPVPEDTDPVELPHPCVVPLVGSDFASLYDGNGEFIAPDAQPLTGEYNGAPYHVGMSLARAAVNQALFATYNAGVLCIELDSESVHVLAEGAFPLSAGTLDLLTEGKLRQFAAPTAPALLTVVPSKPPKLTLGAGDDTEGHIIADWDDVEISFYVLIYERFSRVFAVDVDISASLTVFVDPSDQTLRLAISDGPTIDGFEAKYNELLPGVAFDEVLESLVSLAFDSLLGDDLGFGYDISGALADALGVPLYIDFRGLETVPATGTREFLNAYLSLTDTPVAPRTAALPSALRLPDEPGVHRLVDGARSPLGEVRLVGVSRALTPEHEVFAQVDFGVWRGPFRPADDGVVTVRDPKLALVGEHVLRFRARHANELTSLTDLDGSVRLWVDVQAPWAELRVDGGALVAAGQDVGTRPEDLWFSWKLDDGAWSEAAPERRLEADVLEGVRRASVRAHDLAGNVSRPVTLDLATARVARERRQDLVAHGGSVAPPYGCSGTAPSTLGALGLLLGLAALRRRRARVR